jgi:hypothetical protein
LHGNTGIVAEPGRIAGHIIVLPDRTRLGMFMSSLLKYLHVLAGRVGKEGQRGLGKGPKIGQLTLRMGPARAEVRTTHKVLPFQVRGLSIHFNIHKVQHMQ